MTEFRTAAGVLVLQDGAVQVQRPDGRLVIDLAEVDDVVVTDRFVHVRGVGRRAATDADFAADPTVLRIRAHERTAAETFRAAVLAAKLPSSSALALAAPAAARPDYGPATRDRPDVKAAMHWFRQISELPDTDRWLTEAVENDELVLGAFEVWRNDAEGWQPMLVTDRRLLYATPKPTPLVLELPISIFIRIEQGESNDSGHVKAKLVDRTGWYHVWLSNQTSFHRFFQTLNSARSYGRYAKAPAPEPVGGATVLAEFAEFVELSKQLDAGTIGSDAASARLATIFNVGESNRGGHWQPW